MSRLLKTGVSELISKKRLVKEIVARRCVFDDFESFLSTIDDGIQLQVSLVYRFKIIKHFFREPLMNRCPEFFADENYGYFVGYFFGLNECKNFEGFIQRPQTAREKYICSSGVRKHQF